MRRSARLARPHLTTLEDRTAPANVVNVLANLPEANQSTATSYFTQSGAATLAFGSGPTATVLVAYNDSGSLATGGGLVGLSRSTDGGVTFTDLGTLPGGDDLGDPYLARNNATGRIYLATASRAITNGIRVFASDDNGMTFALLSAVSFTGTGIVPSRPTVVVDNFAGAGQGNVYVGAFSVGTNSISFIARSTDNGQSFSTPVNPLGRAYASNFP